MLAELETLPDAKLLDLTGQLWMSSNLLLRGDRFTLPTESLRNEWRRLKAEVVRRKLPHADGEMWRVHYGDCIEHMATLPPAVFDMAVFSPPFPSLYAYTDSDRDIGNSEDMKGEAPLHLSFFYRQLVRVMKPGRVVVVHVAQIPRMKRSGGRGMHDFRGLNIRLAERAGFVFEYDWAVRKNPQALRDGSRVLTPRGWVPIESLLIGSQVIGTKGHSVNVVGVHPQGVRPLFRVKTSDGASVDCDGRHLWSVRTTRGVAAGADPVTLTTEAMAARGLFMPSGEPRFYLPIMERPAILTGGSVPIHPYTLGVLLGDGMLSSRGTVGVCTQRGIVERMPLPEGHSVRMLPGSEKGGDVASWHILGSEWHKNVVVEAVRELGLSESRAWEKFIPPAYLFGDESTRRDLLAGLLDTDGGNKQTGGIKYHTTSPRLAEDVRFLVESLGGLCTVIRRTGGAYTYNGENRVGRDIYELTPRLRDNVCPFAYQPKVEQWTANKPVKGMRRAIVSIEPVGSGPCTCITVDAPDGLFVTENCIVTHNSQAIRTKSRELQFAGLESDRSRTRGAMPDYLLKFTAPGENAVPIDAEGQVSRDEWIQWAEACWSDIRETDTLNVRGTKGDGDTKHVCPLQLGVIDRLVRLFSNPCELVFSPFTGIGSEGYQAVLRGRRFYGCELKDEYHKTACKNLEAAEKKVVQAKGPNLLSLVEDGDDLLTSVGDTDDDTDADADADDPTPGTEAA